MPSSPLGLPQLPGGGTADPFRVLTKPLGLGGHGEAPARPEWEAPKSLGEPAGITDVRELTQTEAEAAQATLASPRLPDAAAAKPIMSVQRIRAWHHEAARLMSCGLSDVEIAEALDCRLSTLNQLRRSPAFQELLRCYAQEADKLAVSAAVKLRATASLVLDRLEEILSETPTKELPLNWLKDIAFPLLDRAGYTPVSKSLSVVARAGTLDAATLAAIKEELRGNTIIIPAGGQDLPADRPADQPAPNPAGPHGELVTFPLGGPATTDVAPAQEGAEPALGGVGPAGTDATSQAQGGQSERARDSISAPGDQVAGSPVAQGDHGGTLDSFR